MKKMQKARAEALEAALEAVAKAGKASDATSVDVPPEEVLTYAKFILGKRPPAKKKRRRTKVQSGERPIYVAKWGTPLPSSLEDLEDLEDPAAGGWKPLGFLTEDGLKEDPSFSVADAFRKPPAATVPAPPTITGATLEKFAEKVRDGDLAADPAPVKAADGIDLRGVRTRWDAERNVERGVYPAMPGVRHEDADVDDLDRGNAAGCEECAAELERRGLTNLNTPDPEETSSPVGEDPGDRGILTQWAEAIRQQDAAREAAREGEKLEEKVDEDEGKDGTRGDDGSPFWNARPEVRTVTLTPASSPVDKRIAEETMGLVPGALDEELTITNEGTFLPDGSPAEKALREDLSATWAPQRHAPETSEKAPDHVVAQGASLGCPECSAEAERRKKRDEALDRGRVKLGNRFPAGEFARTGPLDEDELLAVAGTELYPPYDEEPSRELKIRNRKGEVREFRDRAGASGWTSAPGDPWSLHLAWTSSEMFRRGPWHVV